MPLRTLPSGLRARRQRSGTIYFYFCPSPGIKEVPLGSDEASALAQYQVLQRQLFMVTRPHGIRVLDLINQFQLCEPPPIERHARSRRHQELTQLHEYFTECANPTVQESPNLQIYQKWLALREDTRNLDSVRLFRRIWGFMLRHGYLDNPCPWPSSSSHKERIALELADILCLYAPSKLKQLLGQIFDSTSLPLVSPSDSALFGQNLSGQNVRDVLAAELAMARVIANDALRNSHRDDLIIPLATLTIDDLLELLSSSTRINHLPPGKIDLTVARKSTIARLRKQPI
jgi:hypothetical protein